MGDIRPHLWILASSLVAMSCFSGAGTIGSACERQSECGEGQSCTNGVCGKCGDGKVQPGEICFGPADDKNANGEVVAMFPADLDGDGRDDLLGAANSTCKVGVGPDAEFFECWRTVFITVTEDEEFIVGVAADNESIPGHIDRMVPANVDGNDSIDFVAAVRDDAIAYVGLDVFEEDGQFFGVELPVIPRGIVAADFNGDGLTDFAAGADEELSVAVVLGSGDGTFGDPVEYQVGAAARLAPAADLDGDDVLDLVAVGLIADENAEFYPVATVLLGQGDGTFEASNVIELPPEGLPTDAAIADLDGDGNVDLAATQSFGDGELGFGLLSIYSGDGNGGFELMDEPQDAGFNPTFVALQDINNDGDSDLLVADTADDKILFYLNRGGDIDVGRTLDTSVNPTRILIQDFNEDGVGDLIVATRTGVVSVTLSNP